MSNRLVLFSGTPRAGTTTIASACAERAIEAGYTTRFVGLHDVDLVELRHTAWPHVTSIATDWLRIDGVRIPQADAFVTLPGVDEFLLLRHLAERLRERCDIVVVDAGQIDDLLRLVTWLETLERMAVASAWLRAEIARIMEMIFDAQATIRLVTTPDDGSDAVAAVAGLTLAGFHVDGIVVNRVPGKEDGWPKAWAKEQRRKAKAVDAGDVPVSRVGLDAVCVSLPRDCGLDTPWTPQPRALVEAFGEGYRWTIPMIDPAQQSVRVGQLEASVLIEVGPYRNVIAMPAVVQRCTITRADVFTDHIALTCEPNPEVWPT